MENNFNEVASILRIPPNLRTNSHIETLMKLTKDVQFFNKISFEQNSADVHYECCKVMSLEEYNKEDVVFKFGEYGEKFYIILSGQVSVRVPAVRKVLVTKETLHKLENLIFLEDGSDSSSDEEEEKVTSKKRYGTAGLNIADVIDSLKQIVNNYELTESRNHFLSNEEKMLLSLFKQKIKREQKSLLDYIKNSDNEEVELMFEDFTEIGVLKTGNSFGELALISDRPRSGTIHVLERSSFFVINKRDFTKILGSIAETRLNRIVHFLQKVQIFSSISKSYLMRLAYFFTPSRHKKTQCIFKEGDPNEGVYFIREGEVTLEKRISVKIEPSPIFSSSPQDFLIKLPRRHKNFINSKIIIKSKFEFFGGLESLDNGEKRKYSAVCTSAVCEVLFIPKQHFLNRVLNLEAAREGVAQDHEWIIKRFEKVQETDPESNQKSSNPVAEFTESKVDKFQGLSSCRKKLPGLRKNSDCSFIRKLTKIEVDEAINGRKSFMRKYGSKNFVGDRNMIERNANKNRMASIHIFRTFNGSRCISPF